MAWRGVVGSQRPPACAPCASDPPPVPSVAPRCASVLPVCKRPAPALHVVGCRRPPCVSLHNGRAWRGVVGSQRPSRCARCAPATPTVPSRHLAAALHSLVAHAKRLLCTQWPDCGSNVWPCAMVRSDAVLLASKDPRTVHRCAPHPTLLFPYNQHNCAHTPIVILAMITFAARIPPLCNAIVDSKLCTYG